MTKAEREYVQSALSHLALNNPAGAKLMLDQLLRHVDYQAQVRRVNSQRGKQKRDLIKLLKKAM